MLAMKYKSFACVNVHPRSVAEISLIYCHRFKPYLDSHDSPGKGLGYEPDRAETLYSTKWAADLSPYRLLAVIKRTCRILWLRYGF